MLAAIMTRSAEHVNQGLMRSWAWGFQSMMHACMIAGLNVLHGYVQMHTFPNARRSDSFAVGVPPPGVSAAQASGWAPRQLRPPPDVGPLGV